MCSSAVIIREEVNKRLPLLFTVLGVDKLIWELQCSVGLPPAVPVSRQSPQVVLATPAYQTKVASYSYGVLSSC